MPKIDIKNAVTEYKLFGSEELEEDFTELAKILDESDHKNISNRIKDAFSYKITYQKDPVYIFQTEDSELYRYLRNSAEEASKRFEAVQEEIEKFEVQSIKKLRQQTLGLLKTLNAHGWKLNTTLNSVKYIHMGKELCDVEIFFESTQTIRNLKELLIACEDWLDNSTPRRGRPNHSVYYSYIFQIAQLYQTITNEKFSILRHRVNGEYVPITKGHRFAAHATLMVNKQVTRGRRSLFEKISQFDSDEPKETIFYYDHKMLLNACESAVIKLGKLSKLLSKK